MPPALKFAPDAATRCRGSLLGLAVGDALGTTLEFKPRGTFSPLQDMVGGGPFGLKPAGAVCGTGYVMDSLEAALWAFARSASFEEGALLAVNLGDDADTTGAVYGQLAGAFYGGAGIPARWLERLHLRAEIGEMAERLWAASAKF